MLAAPRGWTWWGTCWLFEALSDKPRTSIQGSGNLWIQVESRCGDCADGKCPKLLGFRNVFQADRVGHKLLLLKALRSPELRVMWRSDVEAFTQHRYITEPQLRPAGRANAHLLQADFWVLSVQYRQRRPSPGCMFAELLSLTKSLSFRKEVVPK